MYKTRKVILAFKFLSKKRIGTGLYEKRELKEFSDNTSAVTASINNGNYLTNYNHIQLSINDEGELINNNSNFRYNRNLSLRVVRERGTRG